MRHKEITQGGEKGPESLLLPPFSASESLELQVRNNCFGNNKYSPQDAGAEVSFKETRKVLDLLELAWKKLDPSLQ